MMLKMQPPTILFEDNHLLVVDKPAGMLCQGDNTGDETLLEQLKQFIKSRDNKPGNVYLGLVHRLDRPVSGTMVFAKTSKAASRLSAQFRARTVGKMYRAIVEGALDSQGHYTHQLERDSKNRITRVVSKGGKTARLRWNCLTSESHQSTVEIELITGLPHQIRCQFAHEGHPIVNDKKYGAKQILLNQKGTLALYCHQMTITHPTTKESLTFTAQPPIW